MSTSSSSSTFKFAACQLMVGSDKDANIQTARKAVEHAAQGGAHMVALPECWNCPYSSSSFPTYAETVPDGPSTKALANLAATLKIYLIGGSIPERDGDKLYNTSVVFDPKGDIIAKHRKLHLFDIDVPGKITFKESDTLSAGTTPTVFDTAYGRIGLGICYDMRFPELALLYAKRGARFLCYPGAFNMTTGPAHWELLQRGRAVDNQVYVATISPARNPDSTYTAWGHSSIISPWGEVVATTDHAEGIVYADIDMSRVEEMRTNIPVYKQKRTDLYNVEDLTS
eukprot:TRINITY_DN5626_c0_g1_i3.p1 TRINITY_DN5626_c0_g1~~TRINITY_DN5626_c0_g1_i3.p1  ORF type:complete len:307 (-),score=72.83 TRINITY_DN5626_c0_g1_i3:30-881(-)